MSTYNFILKYNPYHAAAGSHEGGEFVHTPDNGMTHIPEKLRHNTRYNYAIESDRSLRTDLGHFRNIRPRSMTTHEAVVNDKTWQGAEDSLLSRTTEEEQSKLKEFTGAGLYSRLTRAMVKGVTPDKDLIDSAKTLHSAISKSEIPEDITLFRGMRARDVFTEGSEAIGKVFTNKAFQSSSLLQDNAIQFAMGREPSCILRIKAKKGQKGAYLDGKISHNPQEQEVLLPHNASFIIVGHSLLEVGMGKAVQKMHVYDVEYL